MAALNPPWALASPAAHTQDHMRRLIRALAPTFGVVGATDLAVAANGTPNMTVNVAAGFVFMPATEQLANGGGPAAYAAYNDASVSLSIAASDPTNPRRDLIVAKVQDQQYSGSVNSWSLAVVTGTPAASPADPATPNNAVVLARVTVAASVTSVTAGAITDLRPRAAGVGAPIICTSTTRPGTAGTAFASITPVPGMSIYELDTGKAMTYYSATTGWQPSDWNSSWGRQAYQLQTAPIAGVTTVAQDIAGLSASYTPPANRLTRVVVRTFAQSTNSTDSVTVKLLVDGAQVEQVNVPMVPVNWATSVPLEWEGALSAAAHTIKAQVVRGSGSGTISGPTLDNTNYPQFISVHDIGPNGAPV